MKTQREMRELVARLDAATAAYRADADEFGASDEGQRAYDEAMENIAYEAVAVLRELIIPEGASSV